MCIYGHVYLEAVFVLLTGVDERLGTFGLLVNPEIISLVKDVEFTHRGVDRPCAVSDNFFNIVAEWLAVCGCATKGTSGEFAERKARSRRKRTALQRVLHVRCRVLMPLLGRAGYYLVNFYG
jgi:hypothetical protein